MKLIEQLKAGGHVTILVPNGIGRSGVEYRERTGRAVMRGLAGWVLNMGGRYGRLAVAEDRNVPRVLRATRKADR
jgi:hypothetical protein